MRRLRAWLIRLAGVFTPQRRARAFEAELQSHIDLHVEDNIRRGMTPTEARRRALIALGGAQAVREAYRDRAGLPSLESLAQDLRFALRMIRKAPSFTVTAVIVLALGIGANSVIFSLVNALLLRPLNGGVLRGELNGLYSGDRTRADRFRSFSYPEYADIRDRNDVFASLFAETVTRPGLTEGDFTRQILVGVVSSNYFSTLGVTLAAGRPFTRDEERSPGGDAVAIASFGYWRQHGLRADILGTHIVVSGQPFTIVGVAPESFTGTVPVLATDLWVPLGALSLVDDDETVGPAKPILDDRSVPKLLIAGTLKPGISIAGAESRLAVLASSLGEAFPQHNRDQRLVVHPRSRRSLGPKPVSDSGPAAGAVVLIAVAALVLLVACFNLANMLLARANVRRHDIVIRLALGGGRMRIVRQLLVEGLLLALMGGIAALLMAWWASTQLVDSLRAAFPLPLSFDVSPDVRVVIAILFACLLSVMVFALGPAWTLSKQDLVMALKQSAPLMPRRRRVSMPALLVGAQVALSLALLVAAGVFVRASVNAASSDPGFPLAGGLIASIDTGMVGLEEPQGRAAYAAVLDRLRSLPGIHVASAASTVPFGLVSDDVLADRASTRFRAAFTVVGADYFKALNLPVAAGREFTVSEERDPGGEGVAIIDQTLAERHFAGENPVGQWLRLPNRNRANELVRIVGVVPNVRHDILVPVEPHIYVPFGSNFRRAMTVHVRTTPGTESAMLEPVLRAIRGVDARLPVLSLRTMTNHRDASPSLWAVLFGAKLFGAFGAIALGLATAGVYGLRAYLVSLRTRELGIRMALGASRSVITRQLLGEGARIMVFGLCAGLLLALGLVRILLQSGVLYQVRQFDPLVLTMAPLVLAFATAMASYLPARRALRVDPSVALRPE